MPRSRAVFVITAALVLLPPLATHLGAAEAAPPAAALDFTLETGVLSGGARFALARPRAWNRRVLLLAHAQRRDGTPLRAELDPSHLARKTLLAEGWIVASTSFRRNGLIVADAMADLDELLAHIRATFGETDRVLLEGEGLGGLIVTLMAERTPSEPRLYAAAVAIGPTLHLKEPDSTLGLSLQPKLPLLFLANQSELQAVRAYAEAAAAADSPAPPPAIFRVARDGHANVNQRERLLALRALNLWLDHGRGALPRPPPGQPYFDATSPAEPQPSRVALHADRRGFDAHVTAVSADTGDFTLDAQPGDFDAIGLGKMARFKLAVDGRIFRTVYIRNVHRDARRGDWIVFANADGFFVVGRHRADAAATASVSVGDKITLRRYDAPTSR